jgi:hypothetical protein
MSFGQEVVMSVALFRERLEKSRLHANGILWMPRWLEEFARTHPESNGLIPHPCGGLLGDRKAQILDGALFER